MLVVALLLSQPAFTLCIDPGHPSEVNHGRDLQNGLREVTVCWQVSQELKKLAIAKGIRVVMTKSRESEYVTNRKRAEIANAANAHLMVRIHADTGPGTGFTVYHPNKSGKVGSKTGPSQSVINASRLAAKTFYSAFHKLLRGELEANGLRGDEATAVGRKQGALTGSIYSHVPTLLVEMVFLSNKKDADWIRQEKNQTKMANALLNGILAVARKRAERDGTERSLTQAVSFAHR